MDFAAQSISQRPLSQIERVLYTLISPSQAFQDVLRNRSWWLALALTVLTSFFYSYTVIQKVGVDQTVQNMVQRNATLEHALESDTPKQRAATLAGAQTSLRLSMALSRDRGAVQSLPGRYLSGKFQCRIWNKTEVWFGLFHFTVGRPDQRRQADVQCNQFVAGIPGGAIQFSKSDRHRLGDTYRTGAIRQ